MARITRSSQADASLAPDASVPATRAATINVATGAGRKRGRKPDASDNRPTKRSRKATRNAAEADRVGSDAEPLPRRKARGRPAADASRQQQTSPDNGRQQRNRDANVSAVSDILSEKAVKRKASSQPAPAEASPPASKRRGRPRKSGAAPAATDAQADATRTTKSPAAVSGRKRGRPAKTFAKDTGDGHPSSSPTAPASTSSQARLKRQRTHDQSATKKKKDNTDVPELRHISGHDDAEAEEGGEDDAAEDGSDDEAGSAANRRFRRLVPRTRFVPMATMAKKWAPLEPEAIAAVQELLAECTRPVLARLMRTGTPAAASERRQEQARHALAAVTKRLRSKLVKGIPFPPATIGVPGANVPPASTTTPTATSTSTPARGGRGARRRRSGPGVEADFNYEAAVEGTRALEKQLDPLQHAIVLLERERRREEAALEADYATLRELETNAQAEMRTWRERARKAHVLAPVDRGPGSADRQRLAALELVPGAPSTHVGGGGNGDGDGDGDDNAEDGRSESLFENLDGDISGLATQLSNHMDSLQGNLQQIDGVLPAMVRSRAALQNVLHQRLDPRQYERIVLGR